MNDSLLKTIAGHLLGYLANCEQRETSEQITLHDPIANRIIGSHYSLSHYFAALCLQSYMTGDQSYIEKATKVFNYIYASQTRYAKEVDYHFDFNNYTWALLCKLNQKYQGLMPGAIEEKAKTLLLNTGDSCHGTTNWLPMRAFNNAVRFELTGEKKYSIISNKLLKQVYSVLDSDGMFEDNIIRGKSANPQYHVYTLVGLLLGIHFNCWKSSPTKLSKSARFFLEHIAPDGDFNYYGRGTNQIFGWGPALLLLKNISGAEELYARCSAYLMNHLPSCLDNNGILLENSLKHQQMQWRYYHFATVYIAHLYFWVSMTQLLDTPFVIADDAEVRPKNIKVVRRGSFYAVVFQGMQKYLQERGPIICGIWSAKYGCLFKGPFGPFYESPRGQHECITPTSVIVNYMGVIVEKTSISMVRRLGRLGKRLWRRMPYAFSLIQTPVFPTQLDADVVADELCFSFQFKQLPDGSRFSVPVFSRLGLTEEQVNAICSVNVGERKLQLWKYGCAIGPYHEIDLYCTEPFAQVTKLQLRISDKRDNCR